MYQRHHLSHVDALAIVAAIRAELEKQSKGAAREQKESWEVGESSRRSNFPMTNFGDLRYNAWGGGVPVVYEGQVVGAVGVSGLLEEEDMVLARMGAALFSKT